jgi:hypothetical protein
MAKILAELSGGMCRDIRDEGFVWRSMPFLCEAHFSRQWASWHGTTRSQGSSPKLLTLVRTAAERRVLGGDVATLATDEMGLPSKDPRTDSLLPAERPLCLIRPPDSCGTRTRYCITSSPTTIGR